MTNGTDIGRYVISRVRVERDRPSWTGPIYLAAYDPHWQADPDNPSYPSGIAAWTDDLSMAMRFESSFAAWELWNTQSDTFPLRDDGPPNKPLTAYNVMVTLA